MLSTIRKKLIIMKKVTFFVLAMLLIVACRNDSQDNTNQDVSLVEDNFTTIGIAMDQNDARSAKEMTEIFNTLSQGDTINAKMTGIVQEVCQNKGCWMKVDLIDDQEMMVKFKDYALFMPKDLAGKEVVLNGKAFVNEVSVEEQKHYAEDAGKSAEEIATITQPKTTYSFLADGVMMEKEL